MRAVTWWMFGAAAVLSLAHAADPSELWKPFPVIFEIHAGIVAERTSPTAKERKLTV